LLAAIRPELSGGIHTHERAVIEGKKRKQPLSWFTQFEDPPSMVQFETVEER